MKKEINRIGKRFSFQIVLLLLSVLCIQPSPTAAEECTWCCCSDGTQGNPLDLFPNAAGEGCDTLCVSFCEYYGAEPSDCNALPEAERQALLNLYSATRGADWLVNTGWTGPAGTECDWHGVYCSDGHVRGLYLEENNLSGPLPASISDLPMILDLYLGGNALTGTIPPAIGSLTNASVISLGGNQFTGSLPSEIGNLTQIREFYVNSNLLTGSIPPAIGKMTQLGILDLEYNDFTGTLPPEMGNLKNLEVAYLTQMGVSGAIPPELGGMTALRFLDLEGNSLTGSIPPELSGLTRLTHLYLQENALSGSIPPELGQLGDLTELSLYNNQMTGAVPPELGNLSRLTGLMLQGNALTGSIPPELGNLSQLETLSLFDNQLSGSIPASLGSLAMLDTLYLGFNQLTGGIPPELGQLTSLRRMHLLDNQLSGPIPPELGNLTNLTELWLSSNQFSGSIPPELGNLTLLEDLWLGSNQLSGSIPAALGNMSAMEYLDLADNALTGVIPREIGNLTLLQYLDLSSNQLDGPVPDTLMNLTALVDDRSDFRYNNLYTDNPALREFMNLKQTGGEWESTQNMEPDYPELTLEIESISPRTDGSGYIDIRFRGTDPEGDSVTWYEPETYCTYISGPDFSEEEAKPLIFVEDDPSGTAVPPMIFAPEGTVYYLVVDASAWPAGEYRLRLKVADPDGNHSNYEYSSVFTVGPAAENHPPARPGLVAPGYESTITGSSVVLKVSAFSDPDGDAQKTAYWRIRRADRLYAAPAYDASFTVDKVTEPFTEHTVFGLTEGMKYFWKVGYEDTGSGRIAWSGEFTFKAGTSETDDSAYVPPGQSAVDFQMISFYHWFDSPREDAVFGSSIGYYDTDIYRIGDYDPCYNGGGYAEYGESDREISPGRAFWFFARHGQRIQVTGVPVSTDITVDLPLNFNTETGDGWNMVGPPNPADYRWEDVQVVAYDEDKNLAFGPASVLSPASAAWVDPRLWRWENTASDYPSDTEIMIAGTGYWVQAEQPHVWLRFPPSAQMALGGRRSGGEKTAESEILKLRKMVPSPRSAYAGADDDSPPPPLGGFSETAEDGSSNGGGCFIQGLR